MIRHKLITLGLITFALAFASCGKKSDDDSMRCGTGEPCGTDDTTVIPQGTQVQTQVTAGSISCSMSVDKSPSNPGEERILTISASGGTAPYSVKNAEGNEISFQASTTINRTYANTGASDIIYTTHASVKDSVGRLGSCQVSVTVKPWGAPSCQLITSIPNPRVGQEIEFIVEASGGNGSFSFGTIYDGQKNVSSMTKILDTKYSAKATYSLGANVLSADMTAYVDVTSNGKTARCLQPVKVRRPKFDVYGSQTAALDQTITLFVDSKAYDLNYLPAISAVSSNANITATVRPINGSGSAYIDLKRASSSVTTDQSTTVTIRSIAQNGDDLTGAFNFDFKSTDFSCTLAVTPDIAGKVGPNDTFKVALTSTPAVSDLVIRDDTYADAYSDLAKYYLQTDTLRYIKFPTVGTKEIRLRGYSASRGKYCANANYLSQSVSVATTLASCVVSTSPSTASVGQNVTVSGALPVSSGSGPFSIRVDVRDIATSPAGIVLPNSTPVSSPSGLSQVIRFNYPGLFEVKMTVSDNNGSSVSCTMEQRIFAANGINVEVFDLFYEDRTFALNTSWDVNNPGSYPYRSSSVHFQTRLPSIEVATIDVANQSSNNQFPGVSGQYNWFALVYHGYLNITEPGCYQFRVGADDGAILMLDGAPLRPTNTQGSTNFNSLQAWTYGYDTKCYSVAELGLHQFRLKYYQGPRTMYGINLSWKKPSDQVSGVGYHTIPSHFFIKVQ